MRISNTFYPHNILNFTSSARIYPNTIKTPHSGHYITTTTWMLRPDIDWTGLTKLMDEHFKDKEHVNVYSLGCADGTEPYSMAISLMENVPQERWNKFFPIIASDKDSVIIDAAKSGRINLSPVELERIDNYLISDTQYFINEAKAIQIEGDTNCEQSWMHSYQPIDELKNAILFQESDIIKQLETIEDDGNTVVMCRNVSPYLSEDYQKLLATTLKNKLKPGSLLVLGDFDKYSNFKNLLNAKDYAFKEVAKNIYERIDNCPFQKLGADPQLDTNKCYSSQVRL